MVAMIRATLLLVLWLAGCTSPTEPEPCAVAAFGGVDAKGDTTWVVRTEFCLVATGAVP
jgi:hypothetical protein